MGILDFIKGKKSEKKIDFNILSGSGIIDYIRSNLKEPTEKNVLKVLEKVAQPDADQEHLTAEGDLPWGWYTQNLPIVKPYEAEITNMAVALKGLKGIERITQLEKLISFYNEYKCFCYGKNECYIKYFSDMWEHCHNSRCKDFEYITPYIDELEKLKTERR